MTSRYRIYAAVGLAGVIVLALGFMILGRGQSSSSAPAPTIKPLHPVAKKAKAQATAKAKKAVAKKTAPAANLSVPTAVLKARRTKVTDGMPVELSRALVKHDVVVVALVSPGSTVDELTEQEARAGAHEAGVGFVRVSAANNADVQALSTLVGASASPDNRLLDAPSVLVLRQPHELFVRFNGYIDAATVAQAATNASPVVEVPGKSALADPWVTGANAVCRKLGRELANAPLPTSTAEYIPYLRRLVTLTRTGIASIRALPPPVGKASAVTAMLDDYDASLADATTMLGYAQKGNLAGIRTLEPKIVSEREAGDAIAAKLGANDCASGQA